jgi:hypothetical protein
MLQNWLAGYPELYQAVQAGNDVFMYARIALSDVRFGGKAHCADLLQCPLVAQSGHESRRIGAVQSDP